MGKRPPPPGYPTAAPPTSSSSTSTSSTSSSPSETPVRTANPLPLSAAQEAQVRDLYYARVRGYCAAEIKDFATCAVNRTISATWACRTQRLAMNGCMIAHATTKEEDLAREEWFRTRGARRREREERERLRVEQEKWHREWWGLPPKEAGDGGDTKGGR